MLLKCKGIPVKVGLQHTLTPNSPLQIVTSMSRNDSEGPEVSSHMKQRLGFWLLSTFMKNLTSADKLMMAKTSFT